MTEKRKWSEIEYFLVREKCIGAAVLLLLVLPDNGSRKVGQFFVVFCSALFLLLERETRKSVLFSLVVFFKVS